ncbi:hypothetical protein LINPERHAP1_LOCUS10003 [Linum perenne]
MGSIFKHVIRTSKGRCLLCFRWKMRTRAGKKDADADRDEGQEEKRDKSPSQRVVIRASVSIDDDMIKLVKKELMQSSSSRTRDYRRTTVFAAAHVRLFMGSLGEVYNWKFDKGSTRDILLALISTTNNHRFSINFSQLVFGAEKEGDAKKLVVRAMKEADNEVVVTEAEEEDN